MTRDEVKQILAVMMMLYQNFNPDMSGSMVDVWFAMLKDMDNKAMQQALKWFAESDTSGFAPSVGQLIERYRRLTEGEQIGAGEAWGMVRQAIGNSAYYAEREFKALPEEVQKAVGSPDVLRHWALAEETEMQYAQAQFAKNYGNVTARQREYAVMGADIRAMLEARQAGMALEKPKEEKRPLLTEGEEEEIDFQTPKQIDPGVDRIAELRKRWLGEKGETTKSDGQGV